MNRRCVSSGAGQGHFIPTKSSTLSSDKDCDVEHRRKGPMQKLKRKLVIVDDDEEENEVEEDRGRAETGNGGYGESKEQEADKATPIGDIVRVSGFGEQYRSPKHCTSKSPLSKSKNEEDSKYSSHALNETTRRNYWLKSLLQSVECECRKLSVQEGEKQVVWPDSAVSAIIAIERALNEKFSPNDSKYNEKMRQLRFNLKNNPCLARRVLKWELMPSVLLSMSPTELKEASTEEETAKKEPETHVRVQMTDSRCRTCSQRKVSVANKFTTGFRERYELECLSCGSRQFVSRDRVLTMTLYESTEPKK